MSAILIALEKTDMPISAHFGNAGEPSVSAICRPPDTITRSDALQLHF